MIRSELKEGGKYGKLGDFDKKKNGKTKLSREMIEKQNREQRKRRNFGKISAEKKNRR